MVKSERQLGSGVLRVHRIFLGLVSQAAQCIFFSDTLAHIRYPVAVGVMGWLVGDDSNRSAAKEDRIIENCGS